VGILVLLFGTTVHAQQPVLFLSETPVGTPCGSVMLPALQPTPVHAFAWGPVGDIPGFGDLAGAEFRITGLPTGGAELVSTWSNDPSALLALGTPFDGLQLTFALCQSDLHLGTFTFLALADAAPFYEVGFEAHPMPSNPSFTCPLVFQCDGPAFTAVCADPVRFFLETTPGAVRTPSDPTPADAAVDVPRDTQLSIGYLGQDSSCGLGVAWHNLYFGTSADPPLVANSEFCTPACYANPYDPGPLQPETTYYWKLEFCGQDAICSASNVWSFTTGSPLGVESIAWSQIKQVYR